MLNEVYYSSSINLLYQDGIFFRLGQLMAIALLHGGGSLCVLSPAVFNYLSGMKPGDIIVAIKECPDGSVHDLLLKVCNTVLIFLHA